MFKRIFTLSSLLVFGLMPAMAKEFASHAPIRALPVPSTRPLADGPSYFVDAAKGDDGQDGTEQRPWKTVGRAVTQLQPGETVYLRAGTYYETVRIAVSGTPERPIAIRAYPGELVVLDSGYSEFYETPATAWEPVPGGSPDEFRSTKSYAAGGSGGNFGDSMLPFHRYMTFTDLRSSNEFYRPELNNRADDPGGMYCGPGPRRNPETGRIHIRLSHTKLDGLRENGYRGETDPRKLPLVIVGADIALLMEGAKHVRIQDLVVRGAKDVCVRISRGEDVELDGVTLYANSMAIRTDNTHGLRIVRSAVRGHASPWHSRFQHKNRAGSGYLILTGPGDADFEIAHSELTDHHDCITFRSVDGMKIHHCLLDNFNDDGIEPGPKKERGRTYVYQNVLSRILSPFTAHGDKTEPFATEPDSGMYVYRNIIDLRLGTFKNQPDSPDSSGAYLDYPTGLVLHDHGSPTQQNYYVYHNTFVLPQAAYRNYYAFGWGAHTHDSVRRVFNNIFVQVEGSPALNFTAIGPEDDFQADGNLFWAAKHGPEFTGDLFAAFRNSPPFETSKKHYAPGWSSHDLFADPKFTAFGPSPQQPTDFRLQSSSAAIDVGVVIPTKWPDPLRDADQGKPDLGALPLGAAPLTVGIDSRTK